MVKSSLYRNPGMLNNGDHDSATTHSKAKGIDIVPSFQTQLTMMISISDLPRSFPTVHIPSWDSYPDDLTPHIHSPAADADVAMAALQRYLPSNKDDAVDAGDSVDAYSCDNFRMFEFKVKRCARARSHDWTECPFAHPGEKARRRDPRKFHYSGSACPDFRKGVCRRGDACEYAHGVFECWLHPARYRTQPCKDGTHCRRRVCFFAHTPEQLRILPYTNDESPSHDSLVLFGSSQYSPPPSPTSASPPVSPGGSLRLSQLTESMRGMQINKLQRGMSLNMSWGVGKIRPGFMSLPTTPIRTVTRSGSGRSAFDAWEEEPAMERVESGRALREKIYAKLVKENSLDRVGRADSPGPVPDFGWVSELVK